MALSSKESARLKYINSAMCDLYDSVDEIYECMVDKDLHQLDKSLKEAITQLKDILQDLDD